VNGAQHRLALFTVCARIAVPAHSRVLEIDVLFPVGSNKTLRSRREPPTPVDVNQESGYLATLNFSEGATWTLSNNTTKADCTLDFGTIWFASAPKPITIPVGGAEVPGPILSRSLGALRDLTFVAWPAHDQPAGMVKCPGNGDLTSWRAGTPLAVPPQDDPAAIWSLFVRLGDEATCVPIALLRRDRRKLKVTVGSAQGMARCAIRRRVAIRRARDSGSH
jgi:hypothetical protein